MHDIYYCEDQNGVKSCDLYIYFEKYPTINMGQEKMEKKTVPGRGNLWMKTGTYSDTEIDLLLDVNTLGSQIGRLPAYLKARAFLENCRRITFCDTPGYFYKVKYAELAKVNQYLEEGGDFSATLICEPGVFVEHGTNEHDLQDVMFNPYSVSEPEYHITGEGMCTLTVNGKAIKANVAQNLTINTGKMVAYRTDGTMQNTEVSGNYDDLYLLPGENRISITEGFQVKVTPNWRCL